MDTELWNRAVQKVITASKNNEGILLDATETKELASGLVALAVDVVNNMLKDMGA